ATTQTPRPALRRVIHVAFSQHAAGGQLTCGRPGRAAASGLGVGVMADTRTGWRAAGVSVAGVSHGKAGTPCQDAHLCTILPSGVVVAAVADGAGSAAQAEVGSAVAVWAAVDKLTKRLRDGLPLEEADWHELLREGIAVARTMLAAEAAARECQGEDLATTLLLAVATPELIAAGQVGDGAVWAALAPAAFRLSPRPPIKSKSTQTRFS